MKQKQAFSGTISANPYNNTYYTGTATQIKVAEKPQYQKDQYAVSYLKTQDFITTQIAVSKNIPEDDVGDAIESQVYEELGLDMAIEYQINYVESAETAAKSNASGFYGSERLVQSASAAYTRSKPAGRDRVPH